MSSLLELLGKGLEKPFIELILPYAQPLNLADAKHLSEEVARCGDHVPNKLRLALHYGQSGAWDLAEELFANILAQSPGNAEARLAWAAMHLSTGAIDKAIEQLRQAYAGPDHDSRVIYGLGFCYERQGEIETAMEFYAEAASSRPYLRHARERMAAIHLRQNDYVQAIAQCRALQEECNHDQTKDIRYFNAFHGAPARRRAGLCR